MRKEEIGIPISRVDYIRKCYHIIANIYGCSNIIDRYGTASFTTTPLYDIIHHTSYIIKVNYDNHPPTPEKNEMKKKVKVVDTENSQVLSRIF